MKPASKSGILKAFAPFKMVFTAKAAVVIAIMFSLGAFGTATLADEDEPTLKEASIEFHTNDDNRDHDTRIDVTFYKDDDEYAKADNIDWNREFKDNESTGPYALKVSGHVKKSEIKGSRTKIVITPNGHDTWKFNFKLTLKFSDESTKIQEQEGLTLNEKKPEGSWRW